MKEYDDMSMGQVRETNALSWFTFAFEDPFDFVSYSFFFSSGTVLSPVIDLFILQQQTGLKCMDIGEMYV